VDYNIICFTLHYILLQYNPQQISLQILVLIFIAPRKKTELKKIETTEKLY